jgi:hypothetical protein
MKVGKGLRIIIRSQEQVRKGVMGNDNHTVRICIG